MVETVLGRTVFADLEVGGMMGERFSQNTKRKQKQRHENRPAMDVEAIRTVMQEPMLRVSDRPWLGRAGGWLLQHPDENDPDLIALFEAGVAQQLERARTADDVFYPRWPPPDAVLPVAVPVVQLPNGVIHGLSESAKYRGTAIAGPTGAGKSSLAMLILTPLAEQMSVIVFDRKKELRVMMGIPIFGEHWTTIPIERPLFAMLQRPKLVPREVYARELVDCLARSSALFASRRVGLDKLMSVYEEKGDAAELIDWERAIDTWHPKGLRESGYREALLWTLRSLRHHVPALSGTNNTLLSYLNRTPGGVVFEMGNLPSEHYSFVVAFITRWLALERKHTA